MGLLPKPKNRIPSALLQDRYIVPPFSILDTKQGYWITRRNIWKSLGIKSELGRGDNLTYRLDDFNYMQNKNKFGKCLPESIGDAYGRNIQATSIFDPVRCEIMYRWFCMDGGSIFDPFAGGSVRGIVASVLGMSYTGIDLRPEQVDSNRLQMESISTKYDVSHKASWVVGDSYIYTSEHSNDSYDMIFTCPPYFDLEVYSDNPKDLSNFKNYQSFLDVYSQILMNSVKMLRDDCFAAIVVGNIRNHTDSGYYDFVGDTVKIMQNSGCIFYNECILINTAGTLPIRAPKQFDSSRKVGKMHQNVLIFFKGDPKHIKEKFGRFIREE